MIIVVSDRANPGDTLTLSGATSCLREATSERICRIPPSLPESYVPRFDNTTEVRAIILAGSPWVWDCCEYSAKYSLVWNLHEAFPKAKLIGLGLGSCFMREMYLQILNDDNEWLELTDIAGLFDKFSFVSCRDVLAQRIFQKLGIKSVLLNDICCCSPRAIKTEQNTSEQSLLVFHDPSKSLSSECVKTETVKRFIGTQLSWAREHLADVICEAILEGAVLQKEICPFIATTNLATLTKKLSAAGIVLSGRVHMAILAKLLGAEVQLLPVDSRFLTALRFGVEPMYLGEPWPDVVVEKEFSIEDTRKVYVDALREHLS